MMKQFQLVHVNIQIIVQERQPEKRQKNYWVLNWNKSKILWVIMQKGMWKKLTEESAFSRAFACWANNHLGWRKYKKWNKRKMRRKLKEQLNEYIGEVEQNE